MILAALADGRSLVTGLSRGADVRSTARCLRRLGARISSFTKEPMAVVGWGQQGWREPDTVLHCGNSGTTMRLLCGLLSSRPGLTVLTGDQSLRKRPMRRVIEPLTQMGALVRARKGDRLPPLAVVGDKLKASHYHLPVASAQVKSCLMLAGLAAEGTTRLTEPGHSRDHTERMLEAMGVPIRWSPGRVEMEPFAHLEAFQFAVPGDLSSAAFLVAATVMRPGARLRVEGVGLNPGRTAFLDILKAMGAGLEVRVTGTEMGEPVGEVEARGSELTAVEVGPDQVPGAIDELPLLAVVATQARGATRLWGAAELRHKESDRIGATARELSRLGARIEEKEDGFIVEGGHPLKGALVECHHDHRLEMGLAVAGLFAEGTTRLKGTGWAAVSFPTFWQLLPGLAR